MSRDEEIISNWVAEMYDQDETEIEDVEFALSIIGSEPKHILEVACGSGRMLVPFAKAGHFVHGFDSDDAMLSRIESKVQGIEQISWEKADAFRESWGKDYDVVVVAANFLFNIVSDQNYEEAQALIIEKSAQALAQGGYLYIDYNYTLHPEYWFEFQAERVIWQGQDSKGNFGKMSLLDSTYDRQTNYIRFKRLYELELDDGRHIQKEIICEKHFLLLDQLMQWLEAAGFEVEKIYGDYMKNSISENTNKAIVWARKK